MLYIETDVKCVQQENDLKVDFVVILKQLHEWLILQTKKLFHSETQNKNFVISSDNRRYIVTSHPTPQISQLCSVITCLYPLPSIL